MTYSRWPKPEEFSTRWATTEEIKSRLTPINYNSDVDKSGIPVMYDDDNLYIKNDDSHTLIVGTTGSGKTQTILLPRLRLAIKAEESFIVHDVKGEMYNVIAGELKKQKYNVVVLNLSDPTVGNTFNPLSLPYELYKSGDKDKANEILENLAHYFIADEQFNPNVDPFWQECAKSLFVGLSLYLFDNAKEGEININSIINLATDFDKVSTAKGKTNFHLSTLAKCPSETKGSIIAVFNGRMRLFVSRELLLKTLCSPTDFDIKSIQSEKTALFIISNNKPVSRRLVPLIIDECYCAASLINYKTRRLNVMIDEFESLIPFKDFNNMLTLARSNNIVFSVFIRSLLELRNAYGLEGAEVLKIVFGNIIYLLANDIETLEEISRLCGSQSYRHSSPVFDPLISVDELKLLDPFEAIILMPRINPIRTKLLPDFKIDWKFSEEKVEIKKANVQDIKTYSIN